MSEYSSFKKHTVLFPVYNLLTETEDSEKQIYAHKAIIFVVCKDSLNQT